MNYTVSILAEDPLAPLHVLLQQKNEGALAVIVSPTLTFQLVRVPSLSVCSQG